MKCGSLHTGICHCSVRLTHWSSVFIAYASNRKSSSWEKASGVFKYNDVIENNEDHILGDEFEEYDVEYEPYDAFTEEDVGAGLISRMLFRDKSSLFAFYKERARLKDFSIVKRTNKVGGDTTIYNTYCCDWARNHKAKYITKSNNCKARNSVIVDNYGFWRVSKVINEHNHDLLSGISRLRVGHRLISQSLKMDLVAQDRSKIRPFKNIRFVEIQYGGPQNLGCTLKV